MQGQGCTSTGSSICIVQLAAKDIFQSIKEEDDCNSECAVSVSYVKIHNRELRDLLNEDRLKSSPSLIMREEKQIDHILVSQQCVQYDALPI